MRSLYRALGLAPGADDDQIKYAFRQLAKQSHPDVNAGESTSGERFKEIHQAYRLLRDPQTRAVLDLVAEQAHAATHRRWLMAMATMAAAFILTVGSGLLFLAWQPNAERQGPGQKVATRTEGKTPAATERKTPASSNQHGDAENKAKPARPAAAPPAAAPEVKPAQTERPPASAAVPAAQADKLSIEKPPAGQLRAVEMDWAPSLVVAPHAADRLAEWSTYRNERFGFSLKLPAHVFTAVTGERDDEVLFVSHDGRARLRVSGTPFNRETTTLPAYRQRLMAERYGDDAVLDHTPLHKTWFAFSGSRGDKNFYARVVCACDARSLHAWELTYPPSERRFYEPIVEQIRRSYRRRGEDEAGHCRRSRA